MDLHEKWRNLTASLDDKSPKIKIVVGVVGLIAAGVGAAIAATKIKDDVVEEKKDFENIKRLRESSKDPRVETKEIVSDPDSPDGIKVNIVAVTNPENVLDEICDCYSDKDFAKDVIHTSLRYAWKFLKRFGIPIIGAAASAILIFNGANVLTTRLAGTAEALATVTSAYTNYRQAVIEKYGEKVDEEIRLGLKEQTITVEETEVDEEGKEKVVKKKQKAKVENGLPSMFARYIDESCSEYVKNITQLEMFAESQEKILTQVLRLGNAPYITLGDIYKAFGLPQFDPRTGKPNYGPETLVMGVVYNKDEDDLDSDNYVDFRCQKVFYMDTDGHYKAKLLIDPNVSYIYNKLPKALGYADKKHEDCTM